MNRAEQGKIIRGRQLSDQIMGIPLAEPLYLGESLPEAAGEALQIAQRLRFKRFYWRLGLFEFDHLVLANGTTRSSEFYQRREPTEGMRIYERCLEDLIHPRARIKMHSKRPLVPNPCPWYMKNHYRIYATYLSEESDVTVAITLFDRGMLAQLKPFQYSHRACLDLAVSGESRAPIPSMQEKVEALYRELVFIKN